MANPTTNFGWVMPTSTDLVTDLPADFAVFGQGVDTSFQYLNGGTTGQILSKTSNTNLAFTWITPNPGDITGVTAGVGISGGGTSGDVTVTNSMATAIDAKGDLIAGTGADTFARLGVGTNGQLLAADSTAATGLAWTTPTGGGGKVLQVVSATTTTSTTVASTTFTDTTLTVSITPSSATSKILVMFSSNAKIYRNSNEAAGILRLLRNSTGIWNNSATANTVGIYDQSSTGGLEIKVLAASNYLDSPATTSALTYKIQGKVATTANSQSIVFQNDSNESTITVMEIGA